MRDTFVVPSYYDYRKVTCTRNWQEMCVKYCVHPLFEQTDMVDIMMINGHTRKTYYTYDGTCLLHRRKTSITCRGAILDVNLDYKMNA